MHFSTIFSMFWWKCRSDCFDRLKFDIAPKLRYVFTGCKSKFRKIFEFKIWKESTLVLKQMIPQKKALIFSFKMTPLKWVGHYHGAATPSSSKITYAFHGERAWAWCPFDNSTPSNFPAAKSWVSELSSEVSFVSVLAMVLSEYWKRLVENFQNKIISTISQNDEN